MRLKTVFTILFCCSLYGLHAQTEVSISGHILDKADGLGLPFVTILLQVEGDSMVAGAISDDAGRFNITNVQVKGNCVLVSSYIGYETVRTPFWVGEKNNHYDLGKINLSAVSTTLEDVVITAKKALVDAGLDQKDI